jgi:hypothetical protein
MAATKEASLAVRKQSLGNVGTLNRSQTEPKASEVGMCERDYETTRRHDKTL